MNCSLIDVPKLAVMTKAVLDASAVIAYLNGEDGAAKVSPYLGASLISAVNLSEVVAKATDRNMEEADIIFALASLGLETVSFDENLAVRAGVLRRHAKGFNLSFADRACLALAQREGLKAVTADKVWVKLDIDVDVELIR